MQSWPELQKAPSAIFETARSTSASGNTSTGALPPSSRCNRLRLLSAEACSSRLPVRVDPVSEDIRTRSWSTSRAPTEPSPVTMPSTPGGRCSAARRANRSAVSGVCSDGLSTRVLPVISAGQIFQIAMRSG